MQGELCTNVTHLSHIWTSVPVRSVPQCATPCARALMKFAGGSGWECVAVVLARGGVL